MTWVRCAVSAVVALSAVAGVQAQPRDLDLEIAGGPAAQASRLDMDAISSVDNILIDRQALGRVLTPWLGKDLSAADLDRAIAAVGEHLRGNGHPAARVLVRREGVAQALRVQLLGLSPTPAAYAQVPPVEPVLEVRRILIDGSQQVSAADLQEAVKPWVGRSLTVAQLQEPANAVTALLKSRGLSLAQALVPAQSVTDGQLRLQVIEGVIDGSVGLAGVKISGVERTRPEVIAQIVAPGAPAGQPLRVDQLEPRLLLLNELPGLRMSARLVPGQQTGTTALELSAQEEKANSASVYLDNHGNRYTGQVRIGADLEVYSPSGRGDLLSLGGVVSEGSSSARLAWSTLTGWRDSRMGLSISGSRSDLLPQIIDARFQGNSAVVGLFGQMPLKRSATESLSALGAVDYKNLSNNFEGILFDKRQLGSASLGLAGAYLTGDRQGQARWSGTVSAGQVRLVDSLESLNPRRDTEGTFSKASGDYRLTRPLAAGGMGKGWTAQLRATGQLHLSGANLDNSERFAMGGPEGVRGYPVGEGMGDSGYVVSVELSRPLEIGELRGSQGFVFGDTGGVLRNPRTAKAAEASDAAGNSYSLHSVGVGIRFGLGSRTTGQLTLSAPVGSNPGRVKGLDSDGRSPAARLWFTGSSRF